ncbi:hypothetical protein [Rhizobium hidalgonense]|uniref:hypothetical protein n=1 Tax=Rhizobium hidalgonense TaxID=1538159 RepID=UPI0028722E64|nr:hypothetical protein [Rhizobium hidalgonense]MDR9805543.1 hypothetical protein [Rhizobium hidalgonense]
MKTNLVIAISALLLGGSDATNVADYDINGMALGSDRRALKRGYLPFSFLGRQCETRHPLRPDELPAFDREYFSSMPDAIRCDYPQVVSVKG